jgi:N-methylhydantoinase A
VTDASVVLGLLRDGAVLGGARRLDRALAVEAIERELALPLGLSTEEAALGVHAVATANMAAAVREMTMGKGVDPTGLAVVVGGGAGALHGAALAESLGFREVIVPWEAGVLCAYGMVETDIRYDRTVSIVASVDDVLLAALPSIVERAKAELDARLDSVRDRLEQRDTSFEGEVRYEGQFHELSVALPERELLGGDPAHIRARFSAAHARAYGFTVQGAGVELVNLRVSVIGRLRRAGLEHAVVAVGERLERTGTRRIYPDGDGWIDADEFVLAEGAPAAVEGPAMIDLPTTTILVPPRWRAVPDRSAVRLRRSGPE